jgi:hypothetical protein
MLHFLVKGCKKMFDVDVLEALVVAGIVIIVVFLITGVA